MSGTPRTLLRARWLATMIGPPVEDGAVLVERDAVVAAGPAADMSVGADVTVHDYGDAVILPGLVNAHAHLDLTHVARPPHPGRFIDWLTHVIGSAADDAAAAGAVAAGVTQCLRFGVTTVCDITRRVGTARAKLLFAPVRAVVCGEVVGMARRRHVLPGLLEAATAGGAGPVGSMRWGVSPHAPYSIDADGYRQCLAAARHYGLPLTTHLAESPDEAQFLSDHAGPFRELWDRIGGWDDGAVPRFEGGPVAYARSLGLLDYPLTSLAHVNYCDDEELALLAAGRASVVYCPRTHAYFGHPPHRWRQMLARGINVAVGTDSAASSPDLNLVDDLRLLHRLAPELGARTLWEMATVRAARALGIEREAGTLSPGNSAGCAVFAVRSRDPLSEVLEGEALPLSVWAAGQELAGTLKGAGSGPRHE